MIIDTAEVLDCFKLSGTVMAGLNAIAVVAQAENE